MDNVSLWGVIFVLPILTVAQEVLYMDKYGNCNMGGYYTIGEDAVKLKARGGAAYTAKICKIKFRAERDEQICIIFDKYDVKDRVNLMVYDDKKSSGNPMYSFGPQSSPSPFCSSGRYLTLVLDKDNYMSTNYQFELRIMEESQTDFVNGLNGFVMSIGVIIAIIIGVVVLITVFAIVIVCCCCKTSGNQYDQHGGMKMKRQSGTPQANTNQRPVIEPSAPPLHEVHYGHDGYQSVPIQDGFTAVHEPPPAYTAEPPPYSTTDLPS